jgi:hypothetical protein
MLYSAADITYVIFKTDYQRRELAFGDKRTGYRLDSDLSSYNEQEDERLPTC